MTAEAKWTANILTIFPDMFPGFLGDSLSGRALSEGKWALNVHNIRDYAEDKHKSVDDTPFGGGAGMVMRPDVLHKAVNSVYTGNGPLIYMSPRGKTLNQQKVRELATQKEITVLCGRFEGVDQRLLDAMGFEEISIGDVILSGGEPAAMLMMDAIVRLLPSVLGNEASLSEESFETGLLEYPQYTRPQNWQGVSVPEVLMSGHHAKIAEWRLEQAKEITKDRRPDLWHKYVENKSGGI